MPTDFPSPRADELTPDQRRERIAAIFAQAALRRLAVLRMSNVPAVDETALLTEASPSLKLIAPSRQRPR